MPFGLEVEFEERIWWRCPECNQRNSIYYDECFHCVHVLIGAEKINVKNAKERKTTSGKRTKKELITEIIEMIPKNFHHAVYRPCECIVDEHPEEQGPKGIIRKARLEIAKNL